MEQEIPCIKKVNGIDTLVVNDKPFIIYGGEIHNSSASSLNYMMENVWPNLKSMNLNTLVVPIYWEQIEPIKGMYNFAVLDGLLERAREEGMKMVLLWFGLWKNGESHYVPEWVKKDTDLYFRACYSNENVSETISPLCNQAVMADGDAFTAFMKHLKEADFKDRTVLMVQVENEIGFLKAERDSSKEAQIKYRENVPEEVGEYFCVTGNWAKAFGEDGPEYFMAYYYAKAVETIAKRGKEEYQLPLYVNAWLEQFPDRPGVYPSGGPVAKMIPLWKLAAPSIDLYAPDIYVSDFHQVCEDYTQYDNPLFIPEARRDVVSASNVFYAIGQYNAIGFSPFGIEDFMNEEADSNPFNGNPGMLTALNIDMSGFTLNGTGPYLAKSYEILQGMQDFILAYRGTNKIHSFLKKSNHDKGCILALEQYDLKITYQKEVEGKPVSAGIVIEVSLDNILLCGTNYSFDILPKKGKETQVSYLSIEEGKMAQSKWESRRILNGDERSQRSIGEMPETKIIRVYEY